MTKPQTCILSATITALVCVTAPRVSAGQTPVPAAELAGVVTDGAAAVIPGVEVSATNTQSGVASVTISNETGSYRFAALRAGTYRINAELPGFRTQSYTSVPLAGAARIRLNFALQPGEGTTTSAIAPTSPLQPQELTQPAAQTVNRVRVAGNVLASLLLQTVPPVYPRQARDEKIEGAVVLEVQIDKTGLVSATRVISGHPMLTQAAMDAVKQWVYKPVMLNGEPIDVTSTVTVNFTLAQ